jgi:hypothetical protein
MFRPIAPKKNRALNSAESAPQPRHAGKNHAFCPPPKDTAPPTPLKAPQATFSP